MFESSFSIAVTKWAESCGALDRQYYKCWQPLKVNFDPNWTPPTGPSHTSMKTGDK